MQEEHVPYWQAMIDYMVERDLAECTVLDFGCNQGRFLQLLYEQRRFREGVGVDASEEAIARAREEAGDLPLRFEVGGSVAHYRDAFDLAFSHEVLYLLEDLDQHAGELAKALKPGGVYYASIGAHLENPLWPRWRQVLRDQANIPPRDYSLEEVAAAFKAAGFGVGARRLRVPIFHPYDPETDGLFYPTLKAKLDYFDYDKILFRFVKAG